MTKTNAAPVLDSDELAAYEDAPAVTTGSEEAERLMAELRETTEPEPVADKLPAHLSEIAEQFAGLSQAKADVAQRAAAEQADIDGQSGALLNATLRRLAVTEELLRRERETSAKLRDAIDLNTEMQRANLARLQDATDEAAGEVHRTAEYERTYRDQYEHEPTETHDYAGDMARTLMMPPARSLSAAVPHEYPTDGDPVPAFLTGADAFDEADIYAEPLDEPGMIARAWRNITATLDAMRNPFRQPALPRRA